MFLLVFCLLLTAGSMPGQAELLHSFNEAGGDGYLPMSGLTMVGDFLYGTTYQGGQNNAGVLFRIRPDGTDYQIMFSFPGGDFPVFPRGALTLQDGVLFGVAEDGLAVFGDVVDAGQPEAKKNAIYNTLNAYVFRINPDGSDFDLIMGWSDAWVNPDLLAYDGALFATVLQSESHPAGAVFRINPDGSFTVLKDFMDEVEIIDEHFEGDFLALPSGGLCEFNGALFGMTLMSWQGSGAIYRFDPDGGNYEVIYHFDGENGVIPYGQLTVGGNYLYGRTVWASGPQGAPIFRINPWGGEYAIVHLFPDPIPSVFYFQLSNPMIYQAGYLYGSHVGLIFPDDTVTAASGFASDLNQVLTQLKFKDVKKSDTPSTGAGLIYRLRVYDGAYAQLHQFNAPPDGLIPIGRLVLQGSDLFGTTLFGGANEQYGSVFALAGVVRPQDFFLRAWVGSGCGRVEPPVQLVSPGETAVIRAFPDPGYRFSGWKGDFQSTANPLTIYQMDRDWNLLADFINQPPLVEIIQPLAGQTVHGLVTVEARASDDSGVSQVELYVDGIKQAEQPGKSQSPQSAGAVGEAFSSSLYTFYWDSSGYETGLRRLRVLARDEAGAEGFAEVGVRLVRVEIGLQAARRQARSWSITREYGEISFQVETNGLEVAAYRLLRRSGDGAFSVLREIATAELRGGAYHFQDKYLQSGVSYTYRVEALDARGNALGRSREVSI